MTKVSVKGVIFDLDATLINLGEHVQWRDAQAGVVNAYRACGCRDEDLVKCTAKGLFNFMHEMDTRLSASRSEEEMRDVRKSIWRVLDKYEAEGVEACGFMPGTEDTLKWLRNNNVRMGVCTSNSGKVASKALQKLNVFDYFESVIGRTPGLLMKPHPDQVLACFKEIGVNPHEGVMIGDSHNDILAGRAAGAKTIAIPVYFTRMDEMKAAKPDAFINSMSELPEALMSLR